MGPIYTHEPSNSLLPSPKPPTTPLYNPSPIPRCQSPLPLSENLSSPEVILHQKDQETQTYLNYAPPPYPRPVTMDTQVRETMDTQVREHFLNPDEFLKVFHHNLESLYSTTPHHPHRPIPDVFREKSPIPSAPAIPRPKTAFTKRTNPSLEDTL